MAAGLDGLRLVGSENPLLVLVGEENLNVFFAYEKFMTNFRFGKHMVINAWIEGFPCSHPFPVIIIRVFFGAGWLYRRVLIGIQYEVEWTDGTESSNSLCGQVLPYGMDNDMNVYEDVWNG